MAKPVVCCDGFNLSPTKALKGSIEIFMEASSTHNKIAAIHKATEFGIRNNAIDDNTAPTKKKGLLLPHLGCHVRSLIYPIIGCTNNPVNGAAIHKIGMSSIFAPRV